jgi:hypothetical protein
MRAWKSFVRYIILSLDLADYCRFKNQTVQYKQELPTQVDSASKIKHTIDYLCHFL